MTESEWADSIDLERMLCFLHEQRVSDRKTWLFAIACCRRLGELIVDPRSHSALEVNERFADGRVRPSRLQAGRNLATAALTAVTRGIRHPERSLKANAASAVWCALQQGARIPIDDRPVQPWQWAAESARLARFVIHRSHAKQAHIDGIKEEWQCQFDLLRDIFGNPFRPVAVDPAWLAWNGGTVVALAKTIYEDRRWDLMPILGDALEDAGCHSEQVLSHCRGDSPHVRGCWVVDLLLGKK